MRCCADIPVSAQVLTYGGVVLQDEETLGHHQIQRQSTLQLVLRPHYNSDPHSRETVARSKPLPTHVKGSKQDFAADHTREAAALAVRVSLGTNR